ncbi:hypothetical protein C0Z16_20230 [Paraburkholderia rhynchosiae]|uniref:Uncharacterized protein n=1 Tax=Paraburkholderia rhynchosiae TaxID=487049 RepID=A0ABX4V2Q2_9BURK|nr:hypothetical protein C0Z16_20230 [Paraburkholderia rhynchosiae]
MEHRCIDFAARWLAAEAEGVDTARRGHRNYAGPAEGLFQGLERALRRVQARLEAQFTSDGHISRVGTVE